MSGLPLPADLARPVLERMQAVAVLSAEQVAEVERVCAAPRLLPARSMLVRDGGPPARPTFLLSGWAMRQRILPDGRKQVIGFLLPGDGLGLHRPPRALCMAATTALTDLTLADAADLPLADTQAAGDLTPVLHALALREDAQMLDHLVRLGRLSATERVAHAFLEFADRLDEIGAVQDGSFDIPLTQEGLADYLGLSAVHTNRTLTQLRREALMTFRAGAARLLDVKRLASIAGYVSRRPPARFS